MHVSTKKKGQKIPEKNTMKGRGHVESYKAHLKKQQLSPFCAHLSVQCFLDFIIVV